MSESNESASPIVANFTMPWFMGAAFIPKFNGDRSTFTEWRVQVEAMLRAQGLGPQQQADFIMSALEGEAKRELLLLPQEERNTGDKVFELLQREFAKPVSKAQLRAAFFNCRQKSDETAHLFILRLREVFSKWRQQDENGARDADDLLLDQLLVGLRTGAVKQELNRQIRRTTNVTFFEACREARALEKELDEEGEVISAQRVVAQRHVSIADLDQLKQELRTEMQQELRDMKELLTEIKTLASPRETSQTPLHPCFPASMEDHTQGSRAAHPLPPRNPSTVHPRASGNQWDAQGRPICRRCGLAGHMQRRCPQRSNTHQDF
ncbi:uncharacterized protein LOC112138709 [Oryzias melastigma]|uniref:uncharacterized protein LOC112138709 n=1 Tax=Oryzias melastigma TaxID=30732 RepID=UPI000CF7ED88|nr:uncharacterized protein LOC112138709 [Oryzias melastigma]XP_036067164.1 uncharacterized protein LOC112138709 [Oryzias melastigma]